MKKALRFVALFGAAGLGLFLWRSSPRDVVLVYDGAGGARALEVAILKGDEVVRRATFPSPGGQVRHAVRLTRGEYRIDYTLVEPSGPVEGERSITVEEAQTIVLSLAR